MFTVVDIGYFERRSGSNWICGVVAGDRTYAKLQVSAIGRLRWRGWRVGWAIEIDFSDDFHGIAGNSGRVYDYPNRYYRAFYPNLALNSSADN
ncbi:hypothetical protein [Microcoleus sp. BROC3]|uniref:hypothetical protein n=1 Tax=Microcoleus sp. BROC3 TaxID=3055323 RepID=UPI002FD264D4